MSVGAVDKNTGDRIPTAGNPLDKVGNLAYLHTTAKNDAVSAINEVKDEQANKADNDIVADAFSAAETYAEGDYCTYEGGLYKFKTAHEGAWDAADVDQIKIAGELSELKNTLTHKPLREFRRGNNLYKGDSLSLTSDIMDYDGYIMIIGVFPNAGQESVILPKSVIRLLQTTRHITTGNHYGGGSDYFARIDVELTSSSIKYKAENIGISVGTCLLQIIDYTDALS